MIKYLQIAKKIHRVLVLATIVLSVVMGLSGILLKYSTIALVLPFVDLGSVRYIHNQISPFLTVVLLIMATTGGLMYLAPWLTKRP